MATIKFKTKMEVMEDTRLEKDIKTWNIPKIKKHHCNMNEFRSHSKFGGYANSDLFLQIVNGIVKKLFPLGFLREDDLLDIVEIREGFLSIITIDLSNFDIRGNKLSR